jgi:hypothetical protein
VPPNSVRRARRYHGVAVTFVGRDYGVFFRRHIEPNQFAIATLARHMLIGLSLLTGLMVRVGKTAKTFRSASSPSQIDGITLRESSQREFCNTIGVRTSLYCL